MFYVDGYLLPLPKKNMAAYKRMATLGGKMWKKHGALQYFECAGEDLKAKWSVPFPKVIKLKPGETVVFAFIIFKSRAHRDKVNAAVMKDPAMSASAFKDKPMPFDMKRMVYGGFSSIVAL